MRTVGTILKTHRLKLRMSQNRVAKAIGFSAQFYGKIETDQVGLPLAKFSVACKALKINPEELYRGYIQRYQIELAKRLAYNPKRKSA